VINQSTNPSLEKQPHLMRKKEKIHTMLYLFQVLSYQNPFDPIVSKGKNAHAHTQTHTQTLSLSLSLTSARRERTTHTDAPFLKEENRIPELG